MNAHVRYRERWDVREQLALELRAKTVCFGHG